MTQVFAANNHPGIVRHPVPIFIGINSSRNPGRTPMLDPGFRRGDDLDTSTAWIIRHTA
jgi:hypothetical protein